MIQISEFRYCNRMPVGRPTMLSEAAANALAIALDTGYQEVCSFFYRQAQASAYRPYDPQTRQLVFSALGMEKIKTVPDAQPDSRIVYLCCNLSQAYVLTPHDGSYIASGISDPRGDTPREIWRLDCVRAREKLQTVLQAETCGQGPAATQNAAAPYSTQYYCRYNPNPNGLNIGDCVIRAISAVLHTDWVTSVEKLSASIRGDMKFNYWNNFLNLLLDSGFSRVPVEKINGKFPTGKQICDWLKREHPDAEAAFAYVGNTHVAGILPDEDSGTLRFRYHDSWDSTDRRVIDLYLKEKDHTAQSDGDSSASAAKPLTASELTVDAQLLHPQFGIGTVVNVIPCGSDSIVAVEFSGNLRKNLTGSWILEHCTSA